MRSIFMQNDKLDGWAFWGYGMRRMPAVASVLRLALLNKSTSCSSGPIVRHFGSLQSCITGTRWDRSRTA
jgi:hypothetical protein